MKRLAKYLLAALVAGTCGSFVACMPTDNGPQFLEGSLEKIKLTDSIMLDEYVEYVTDGGYKIEIKGPDGYSVDVTKKSYWQPDAPGVYSIVYTVYEGKYKGVSEFELTVKVPTMYWDYTICHDYYDVGDELVFEEFFDKMNISVESYYDWKMVMDSVTVNDVTTKFTEDDTSYIIIDKEDHTFTYHVETEDGQTSYVEQDVIIRYIDQETSAFLSDNNMEEYNAVIVAEGGVTLNPSTYGALQTTNTPKWSEYQDSSYLAYKGEYGLGDYVIFDFTGNNMPAMGFFESEVKNTMFTKTLEANENDKGMIVTNGFTNVSGNVYSPWSGSVCNRLNMYGPQKIAYPDVTEPGWFRPNAVTNTSMVGMTDQAGSPDTKFRMIMGFVSGSSTHTTLEFYLANRDTGEVYYNGRFTFNFKENGFILDMDEDYYKGNIVAYGHYGKRTVFDKIYPVVHANNLQEVLDTMFVSSQFKDGAETKTLSNVELNVDDYIVKEPGYDYTLNLIDSAGKITPITGDTFTLPFIGNYVLSYFDGKNNVSALNLTACVRKEISSVEDFKKSFFSNSTNGYIGETEYFILTNDIDFTGITINKTEGFMAPLDFYGILDGNGYAITNLTMAPWSTAAGDPGYASFIVRCFGTVKNLAATMILDVDSGTLARHGAFIGITREGAYVSNCYFNLTTPFAADANWPVAAISGGSASNPKSITIENCIGIVTAPTTGQAAGIYGRVNGDTKVNIKNCYAVEVGAASPDIYGTNWTAPTMQNVSAYSTIAAMYADAQTGITAANGWNRFWTFDTVSDSLKFGNLTIYTSKGPQLNIKTTNLFLVSGSNANNVPTSIQLGMLYTEATATFVSSNDAVATVDANGVVTAVACGNATITATTSEGTYTCEVTVYNYHEIASAEDFKNTYFSYTDVPATEYYMLANNVDFAGIVLNETDGYTTPLDFRGVIDGNGYAITNLTMNAWSTAANDPGYASFMVRNWGTVKNLAAIMTLKVDSGVNARHGAFIGITRESSYISNCYFNLTTTVGADINWPTAAISGGSASNGGYVIIENCIGVVNAPTDSLATGIYGRVNGNTPVTIRNCYAVEVGVDAPEVYGTAWTAPTMENTSAHNSVAAMAEAAQTGITAENGWNSFWSVENGTLKFGDLVIYQAE